MTKNETANPDPMTPPAEAPNEPTTQKLSPDNKMTSPPGGNVSVQKIDAPELNESHLDVAQCLVEELWHGRCGTFSTTAGPVAILRAVATNFQSALLVAVVSLSLSIGLGIASGVGPIEGLRTAIWGGLMASLFGSSPYNIVGPAGALSGMLSTYVDKWGADMLPWIAIFSGVFSGLIFASGLHHYMLFMPKSVFEGFTVAVAFIIGFKQINYAFGLTGLPKHETFIENLWESITNLDNTQMDSFLLFFPQFVVMYLLMRYKPDYTFKPGADGKSAKISLPWMVIIPLSTIVLGFMCKDNTDAEWERKKALQLKANVSTAEIDGWILPTLRNEFGELSAEVMSLPDTKSLEDCDDIVGVIIASLSVCFVAVLETLISAKIADVRSVKNERGDFNESRELVGMTTGNVLSGLFGGMPCTGVFVRTSVNQLNGSTHPISQFMNAIIVLLVTAVSMPIFERLPLASVAAVLVTSAIRMVPTPYLCLLWKDAKDQFFLLWVTCLLCTFVDMVMGLLAGTMISFLMQAMRATNLPNAITHADLCGTPTIMLAGPLNYSNMEGISRRIIAYLPKIQISDFIIDITSVTDIDIDACDGMNKLIAEIRKKLECRVYLLDKYPGSLQLTKAAWYAKMKDSDTVFLSAETLAKHVYDTVKLPDAIAQA